MKSIVVLFGKPGAGKGTRLEELLKARPDLAEKFEVLSVGNLLREARRQQTELGKKAASYMDSGALVPDEIINGIVIEGITSSEKSFFLDGFPRTVEQAKAVLNVCPDFVVEFFVEDDVVIQRARDRRICPSCSETYTTSSFKPPKQDGICDKCGANLIQRSDDDPNVVSNRLKVYQEQTYPVLEVLSDAGIKVYTIDNSDAETARQKFFELFD